MHLADLPPAGRGCGAEYLFQLGLDRGSSQQDLTCVGDGVRPTAAMRGEFERGDAARITGLSERTARRILNDVVDSGLLASETPKEPVSLRFPVETLDVLFPQLFPDQPMTRRENRSMTMAR